MSVERKRRLFENIERLHRVERNLPPNPDLVAVRTALEEELGEAVSQRLAASLLGVSHTALGHWTAAGDVPTVYDANGRRAVPVAALLDLRERVRSGHGHVLEPVMLEARRRADSLEVHDLVPGAGSDGHDRAERRSLAYHRALARSLDQRMVDDALRQVWKWRLQGRIDPRYAARWEELLRRSVAEVREAISADDQSARDLRQSSPFAGVLSEPERRKILEQVR